MTITKKTTEVFCTLQVEGTHSWPGCPFDEVAYLRDTHRHVFFIKAYKVVTHSDRDVEFIMLKHGLQTYLRRVYFNDGEYKGETNFHIHTFGAKSCEMIAEELINQFNLSRCEVSEDNENGAIVTVDDVKEAVINIHNEAPISIDPSVLQGWAEDFLSKKPANINKDIEQIQATFDVQTDLCSTCGAGPEETCAMKSPCNACDAET